jgi:hypothetical protein
MIKSSIEKLAESIGFDYAFSDNCVQADLINGLCRGLSGFDRDKMETQLYYIVRELDDPSKDILLQVADFIGRNK